MKHQEGAAQSGVTLHVSPCQRQSESIEGRSGVFIVTSVISESTGTSAHLYAAAQLCSSYSVTPLAVITEPQSAIKTAQLLN